MPNLMGIDGSHPRAARRSQSQLITGANRTTNSALNCCVAAALMRKPRNDRSVLRSANSVSDEAACSNNVQKVTLNTTRMIAASIIWNSTLLPAFAAQIGMPITAARKVANSTLPRKGVARR